MYKDFIKIVEDNTCVHISEEKTTISITEEPSIISPNSHTVSTVLIPEQNVVIVETDVENQQLIANPVNIALLQHTVQEVVTIQEDKVTIVEVNERGLQGEKGESGGELSRYVHVQTSPSTEWVVNHNLNRDVTAILRTTGGIEFEAEIIHTNNNQLKVYTAFPLAGKAICI